MAERNPSVVRAVPSPTCPLLFIRLHQLILQRLSTLHCLTLCLLARARGQRCCTPGAESAAPCAIAGSKGRRREVVPPVQWGLRMPDT